MRILVDADACPIKHIIMEIAKEYNIEVILFCDTAHELDNNYCNVITVDKGKDSVDLAIINSILPGDIIVTQDYGLASIALSKKAKAINNNGMIYTNNNIDRLLFERFLGAKNRKIGINKSNIKKRNVNNDKQFKRSFLSIIKSS
jgi:uncharacterized protein YaiI (UPF0178 family)